MIMPLRTAAIAAVLALLGGCAGSVTGYPSLNPRQIESDTHDAPATPAPAPTIVAPTGTPPALAKIIDDAGKTDAAFKALVEQLRKTIEAGNRATMGSEAWIAAQQAYSVLDASRDPVTAALVELDRLRQQAVTKGEDESAIATATQQVQALDEAERATLAQLAPSN